MQCGAAKKLKVCFVVADEVLKVLKRRKNVLGIGGYQTAVIAGDLAGLPK